MSHTLKTISDLFSDKLSDAPVAVPGFLVLILFITFFHMVVIRGVKLVRMLNAITRDLEKMNTVTDLDLLRVIFNHQKQLGHLWREFSETLHKQYDVINGSRVVTAIRATIPAESYFSQQSLIDGPLHGDFFKHLPGIMTGIGIAGTFLGLVNGLQSFSSSGTAASLAQIIGLMDSVKGAFIASGIAIFFAILVTFLEKIIFTVLYRSQENLCHKIDRLFEQGVGEEYLARLVAAAEDSATHAKQLKDTFIEDLAVLLRRQSEAQIEASADQNKMLCNLLERTSQNQIAMFRNDNEKLSTILRNQSELQLESNASHNKFLCDVLDGISENQMTTLKSENGKMVEKLDSLLSMLGKDAKEKTEAVSDGIRPVMEQIILQLNNTFGSQIQSLTKLNNETSGHLIEASSQLKDLHNEMKTLIKLTSEETLKNIDAGVGRMSDQLNSSNARVESLAETFSKVAAEMQENGSIHIRNSMVEINKAVEDLASKLGSTVKAAEESSVNRERKMVDNTRQVFDELAGRFAAYTAENHALSNQMGQSISKISTVTSEAISKLNDGASSINQASKVFAQTSTGFTEVIGTSRDFAKQVSESTKYLAQGSESITEALGDYSLQRNYLVSILAEFRTVVELAKKDSSISMTLNENLAQLTSKFEILNTDSREFLDQVSGIITESYQTFTANTTKSIAVNYNEFHGHLRSAVALLQSSIEDIEGLVANISQRAA